MEEICIPGSPNWYHAQCVDVSWDGLVAYGSRHTIVVCDPANLYSQTALCGPSNAKILNVSFAPKGYGKRIVASSEDGIVREWNIENKTTEKVNESHKGCQNAYVCWSSADGNLAVTADEQSNLTCWNLQMNLVRRLTFKKLPVCVVSCCPHRSELVAVGTKAGLVCVISIRGKGQIIHSLRGHDSDVVSLAWCPVSKNVFKTNSDKNTCLLASGARDKTIFVWRAAGDGLYEQKINLPLKPSAYKSPGQVGSPPYWTSLCWPSSFKILASLPGGELVACDVKKILKGNMDAWQIVKKAHTGTVFGIVCQSNEPKTEPENIGESNWRAKRADQESEGIELWREGENPSSTASIAWSIGYDRMIVGTSLTGGDLNFKLPSIGGAVHCLAVSPIDGTSLAIGSADKTIRLWNISCSSAQTMTNLWAKVNGRVMALAWHPSKDGWLSYGTSDGRIGLYNTVCNKPPIIFKMYFKDSIYALKWGPALHQKAPDSDVTSSVSSSQFLLYAVGHGQVAVFDPAAPNKSPLTLNDTLKEADGVAKVSKPLRRTDLSWKPDFSLLAIGNEDGSVHLLCKGDNDKLGFLCTVKAHTRFIQDLAWHPQSCTTDTSGDSPYANWLAVASTEEYIHVYDTSPCQIALRDRSGSTEKPALSLIPVATLKGHLQRVYKLAWNPHVGGQLVSVSGDESALVWNVVSQQPVACYMSHDGPVLSCIWSPLNSDVVVTGGQDCSLQVWKISKQSLTVPIDKKKAKKAARKGETAESESLDPVNPIEAECPDTQPKKEHVASKETKKKLKSVFPASGGSLNCESDNAVILRHFLEKQGSTIEGQSSDERALSSSVKKLPPHFGLFGDQAALSQFFDQEHSSLESSGDADSLLVMGAWLGNIKQTITDAVSNGSLCDFHLSLAPMVSHKFWVETCSAYVHQLTSLHEYTKAATFLVATHRVAEAIKLLAENGLHRYAVALAKSRLPPDDPVIETLVRDWACERSENGGVSLAAVCYASVGDWAQAAHNIVRQKSVPRLLLASQLMARSGNEEVASRFARDALEQSLGNADWEQTCSIFKAWPSLKHLRFWAVVFHALHMVKTGTVIENWFQGEDLLTTAGFSHPPFSDEAFCLEPDILLALQRDLSEVTVGTKEKDVWLAATRKITLAVAFAPDLFPQLPFIVRGHGYQSNEEEGLSHVIQAMLILNDHHVLTSSIRSTSLLKLCTWLSPQGPLSPSGIFATPPKTPLHSSLRAYLGAAILHWLQAVDITDLTKYPSILHVIEELKSDMFSVEVMKYSKSSFRIDCLRRIMTSHVEKKHPDEPSSTDVQEQHPDESSSTDVQKQHPDESFSMDVQKQHLDELSSTDNERKQSEEVSSTDNQKEQSEELPSTDNQKEQTEDSSLIAKDQTEDSSLIEVQNSISVLSLSACTGENSSINGSPESANTSNGHQTCALVNKESMEIEQQYAELLELKRQVEKFEKKYIKVPNPYVNFGNLSSFIKNKLASVDKVTAEQFGAKLQQFWEELVMVSNE